MFDFTDFLAFMDSRIERIDNRLYYGGVQHSTCMRAWERKTEIEDAKCKGGNDAMEEVR